VGGGHHNLSAILDFFGAVIGNLTVWTTVEKYVLEPPVTCFETLVPCLIQSWPNSRTRFLNTVLFVCFM